MMGVAEDRHRQRIKDESRLKAIIFRRLEIERILLCESTDNLIPLFDEYNNLYFELEKLKRNLDKKGNKLY